MNFIVQEKILKKNKIFSVPITKETKRIDKIGEETAKITSQKLQLADSARFMENSSSNLVYNLPEGILNTDMIIEK